METVKVQAPPTSGIAADVLRGLSDTPKWLSAKLFYDAEGSRLFDAITELPEYYLTRTEAKILNANADAMLAAAGRDLRVVELGAGSATKTTLLLRAAQRHQRSVDYFPLDVSASALREAQERLEIDVPGCHVHPLVEDYHHGIERLPEISGRKLVLFIGSSIGNFEPRDGAALLGHVRRHLNHGDAVLLGTDMRKSADILLPAYDDAQGVTAAFNRNILTHINRELFADFEPERFAHRAIWNSELSRIEMHLESLGAQEVRVPALQRSFYFEDGETIHTENSYKFTMPMLDGMLANAGFLRERTWSDDRGWFTVHLLRNL
jgi:L-histidine Nalpha-methyltransferase